MKSNIVKLGPDHPHTATSLNNLALLWLEQGAYDAARPFLEQVLTIRERVLGPNHPDTCATQAALAAINNHPHSSPT